MDNGFKIYMTSNVFFTFLALAEQRLWKVQMEFCVRRHKGHAQKKSSTVHDSGRLPSGRRSSEDSRTHFLDMHLHLTKALAPQRLATANAKASTTVSTALTSPIFASLYKKADKKV